MLLSGKTGFVNDALGISRSFAKWRMSAKIGRPKVTNWNTSPWQALVSAIQSATLSLDGPYDYLNSPFVLGGPTVFYLGFLPGIYLTGSWIIDWEMDNDVDTNPNLKITGDSTGPFTITLV